MNEIVTTIQAPDAGELAAEAKRALDLASAVVIDSDPMLELAAGELREIKAKAKALEERRVAITRPLDAAKKQVLDLFRGPLDTLARAESAYKGAIAGYQRRVEAERRAEAARLADLQRKESEKLLAQATKAELAGKHERAAELAARADAAMMVAVAPVDAPKAAGISTRKTYRAIVTDFPALLQFVLATPAFANLVLPDESALNALARAQKEGFSIPGCRLVVEDVVSARAP